MSIKKTCHRLLLSTAVLLMSISQAEADNLWQVYQKALRSDPVLKAQALSFKATEETRLQAEAAIHSTVSAQIQLSENNNHLSTTPTGSQSTTYGEGSYNLTLSRPLYNKPLELGILQAKDRVSAATEKLAASQQDLLVRVAVAYFAILAAEDDIGTSQAEKQAISRQLLLAKERLKVGLGTSTDLYDAQARLSLAQAAEISAVNAFEDARRGLAEIIGTEVPELSLLSPVALLAVSRPKQLAGWLQTAKDHNYTLAQSQLGVEIARKGLRITKAARVPALALSLSHSGQHNDGGFSGGSDAISNSVKLSLTMNLYQGGSIDSKSREAGYRLEVAQQQHETMVRSIDRSVRAAYHSTNSSLERMEALKLAVRAGESALRAKQEGFVAGLGTNLDVLDAQRDLFRAKRDYLKSRYDYITNLLRLKQAAGVLKEADLKKVNAWLQ
ncbi:MAG TPA: hypothetical protein ENI62_04600 [Gammaproteobacteria bacterium]|nr:hypothetical protein [Gammaproteobacteria bacterium]